MPVEKDKAEFASYASNFASKATTSTMVRWGVEMRPLQSLNSQTVVRHRWKSSFWCIRWSDVAAASSLSLLWGAWGRILHKFGPPNPRASKSVFLKSARPESDSKYLGLLSFYILAPVITDSLFQNDQKYSNQPTFFAICIMGAAS